MLFIFDTPKYFKSYSSYITLESKHFFSCRSPPSSKKSVNKINQHQNPADDFNPSRPSNFTQSTQYMPQAAASYPTDGRLVRGNSQESIAESMASLSMYSTKHPYMKEGERDLQMLPRQQRLLPYSQPIYHSNSNHDHVIIDRPIASSVQTEATNHISGSADELEFYATNV